MEQFFEDGEKPTGSTAKPTKQEPNPYKIQMNTKEGSYIPSEELRFDSPLSNEERGKVGSYYQSQNPTKLLSDTQKWYNKLGNMAGHIVTNFVGDTVSGVGSTYEIGKSIVDEISNKDADFTNDLIDFGNSIKDWGKQNLKTYRNNPNESWNVKDLAWWFDGIESAFSSLSFLVGGIGAVKGVGAIAKLTRAEQLLAKAGANVQKLKLGTKIATSATFARNAENMMESYQVHREVKNKLLEEWKNNPDKLEEVKNSDVGKELAAEGREVNEDNLSKFIAGKAAWKSYAINSINIAFDALQVAPIFKGFNPSTRIGKLATSSKVKEANRKLFNEGAKSATRLDKVMDILNPSISVIGREASEGVEEMVNYIGTEEGKNLADQLTNKDNSSFSNRIGKYLGSGDLYESGFWGLLGGVVFQGAAKGANKLLSKGIRANDSTDLRIAEITNRINIIDQGARKIKEVTEDESISENDKKSIINNVKSELSLDLGLRAAQNGNIDLLLEQIKSPEYKQKLIDLGITSDINSDKVIANTTNDILLSEKLYKKHYNSFYDSSQDSLVRDRLIRKSVIGDFFIQKDEQRKNQINSELQELKSLDSYVKSSKNPNMESLIYLEGLKKANAGINEYVNRARDIDSILTDRGRQEILSIDNKIKEIEKQVGDDKLDLSSINPDIISKQAESILLDSINNVQSTIVSGYRKPENIKAEEEKVNQQRDEFNKQIEDDFKDEIRKKVDDGSATVESLEKTKITNSSNKDRVKVIDDAIKKVLEKDEKELTKKNIQDAKSNPIIDSLDEFGDLPNFDILPIDETSVNPIYKSHFDSFVNSKDIDNIRSVTVGNNSFEISNPIETQYLRNKVQESRNLLKTQRETLQVNKEVISKEDSSRFEFNEIAQSELRNELKTSKDRRTIQDIENPDRIREVELEEKEEIGDGFTLLMKGVSEDTISTYIPIFGIGLKNFDLKEFVKINNGDIRVKEGYDDIVRILMSPDFSINSEVEIHWDKDNKKTNPNDVNDINNTAFKIVYNGVTLSYLPTKKRTEYEIKKAKEAGRIDFADRLQLELNHTLKLRSELGMSDKVKKVKINVKGNGTIISRGNRASDLRSLEGSGFNDFYALDSRDTIGYRKLINISKEEDTFSGKSDLRHGIIYAKQVDANGKPFPVPLSVSKVTPNQALEIKDSIEQLLNLLNKGLTFSDKSVLEVKESIEKYIKVDRSENYDLPIGFRIYPQSNKEGKNTDARIVFTFYSSSRAEILTAVVKISSQNGSSWVGIYDKLGNSVKAFNNSDKDLSLDHPRFLEILQRKYQNVDFRLLGKNKSFSYNGKKYSTYKDYLIKEEVIKTDISQVIDSKGDIIGNLFGFANDFKLGINPSLEVKETTSINYEKEIVDSTDDLTYRSKYSLFTKATTPEVTLREIINNAKNKDIEQLADFLLKNIDKIGTKVISDNLGKNSGMFNSTSYNRSGTISISNTKPVREVFFQNTFLHELVHSFTVTQIRGSIKGIDVSSNGILDTSKITFYKGTSDNIRQFSSYIIQERNEVINILTKKYGKTLNELLSERRFYGLTNVYEFISEVMVNQGFRDEIRTITDGNFLTRFYNKIIDFLNKIFRSNLSKIQSEKLKEVTNRVRDFIDKEGRISGNKFPIVNYSKGDDLDLTRNDIVEINNTFEGIILNAIKSKKIDYNNTFKSINEESTKKAIYERISKYVESECPESLLSSSKEVLNNFDKFYDSAIKNISRITKSISLDIEDTSELDIDSSQEIVKNWDDTKDKETSSQDRVTTQIKLFVKSIPDLNSTRVSYDKDNNPLWDRKLSTKTGLGTYIDFNIVYPYLVRNMVGARTWADIIGRLNTMSTVHPSFAYMVNELRKDANLLAQFDSTLAQKYIYDSFVTFIKDVEGKREIWISNEMKKSQYDIIIADKWLDSTNKVIDGIKEQSDKDRFEGKISTILLKLADKSSNIKDNEEDLSRLLHQFANELGIDLSISTIKSKLELTTNWDDFEIRRLLGNIYGRMKRGLKNDSKGWLVELAKMEALSRFDIVENTGLSIKNKPIYGIRNPNFISNWFNDAKSNTEEGRKSFETKILDIAKIPEAQFYNWLWQDDNYKGILYYNSVKGNKEPTNKSGSYINWDFVKQFNFHNFGGAKEIISRESQEYIDFVEKDSMLINLINYINPDDKKTLKGESDFVVIPSIIPSDKGTMYNFEVPKVRLLPEDLIKVKNSKGDILQLKINTNSKIFNSVLKTNWQEVKRIQQAMSLLFEIKDDKLIPKTGLNINDLQQYFHYGSELIHEGTSIDWNKTLLNSNGSPKGKSLYFQNMDIDSNGKLVTLNDFGVTYRNLVTGEVTSDTIKKIKDFTELFINEQINQSYKDYRNLSKEVIGKHSNISDGSFENLITEYTMNLYISYVEQFNMFNGVIAEYKNKLDTSKRASQVFAPIVGLSTEAMKMRYENGNYSTGKTFNGVTIKDLNTKSNGIDYLINSVKDRIVIEKKYSETNIGLFSATNIKDKTPKGELEEDIYEIVSGYLDINSGDAQGYVTLDRLEQVLRGRGMFDDNISKIFNKARKGESLNIQEVKTFQSLKPFYYHKEYNHSTNRMQSNQIKYSSMILFPQLVVGTELEKLMNWMNKTNTEEVFFESAHKVGATAIYKIHNEDGSINEEILNTITPRIYSNASYGIQLDTPEHLLDANNMLAIQFAKLIIANVNPSSIYNINGKKINGSKLIRKYFNLQEANIVDSANQLMSDLKVTSPNGKFIISEPDIQDILKEEIDKRGLSDNYRSAIELNSRNEFNLPLYLNGMSSKWESILTSLFTNRITRQKMPGGSTILGSRVSIDKTIEQSSNTIVGIQWSKEKEQDKSLKVYKGDNGEKIVEVLLSSWSSELFREDSRVSIDEIPDEVKTMIGYRIPTTSKSYMTVFRVVGFLPEQVRGLIITPDDMVTQMGQDFDIDKWFLMQKNFYVNNDGKFILPRVKSEKKEFENLLKERQSIHKFIKAENEQKLTPEGNLIGAIFERIISEDSDEEIKVSKKRLSKVNKRLKEITTYNKDTQITSWKEEGSKQARQNDIFDIFKSILTSEEHKKEIITPSGYPNINRIVKEVDTIYKTRPINPTTELGQRLLRTRNITGKSLVGIAANLNAFGAISQISKMQLNEKIAFKFKFNLNKYDKETLLSRYKDSIIIEDNYAYITFRNLGYSPDNSYLNVDSELILEKASEGVVAFVDNAKDPKAEKLNLTTYTYPLYHTGLLTGLNHEVMGLFTVQPIIKSINKYYFENKGILGDGNGDQIETIKKFYQTHLYTELVNQDKTKSNPKLQKILDRRKEAGVVNSYDKKYLIFVSRNETKDLLGYDPNKPTIFSSDDLRDQLILNSKGYSKLSPEEKLSYLRNQLEILEWFNIWKKAGEGVQDILQVSKTDSTGAGPTMETTSKLVRKINSLEKNERVLIKDKPAVLGLYPSNFNKNKRSTFPTIENYLNYSNKLSVEVLNNLFITQSASFKDVLFTINGMSNNAPIIKDYIGDINKFLNAMILKDFQQFKNLDTKGILGIGMKFNEMINVPIDIFRDLPVANKVLVMQKRQEDYLKDNPQHILNFLIPIESSESMSYCKLNFVLYKNSNTDDNIADSITKMYETGNEFEKDLIESLINYSFITSGFGFGINSFFKVIPSSILVKMGVGDYLREQHKIVSSQSIFGMDTIDKFFRNNWSNSSIVPRVRTRYEYEPNSRNIKKDKDGNNSTIDNSPEWNGSNNIITINERSLKTIGDKASAPYVTIYYEGDTLLYKKYSRIQYEDESNTRIYSFNGDIYYYKVGKLGKDGIYEYSNNSIFKDNTTESNEDKSILQIEDSIFKIEKLRIARLLELNNTTKDKQDDLTNNCGYGK